MIIILSRGLDGSRGRMYRKGKNFLPLRDGGGQEQVGRKPEDGAALVPSPPGVPRFFFRGGFLCLAKF